MTENAGTRKGLHVCVVCPSIPVPFTYSLIQPGLCHVGCKLVSVWLRCNGENAYISTALTPIFVALCVVTQPLHTSGVALIVTAVARGATHGNFIVRAGYVEACGVAAISVCAIWIVAHSCAILCMSERKKSDKQRASKGRWCYPTHDCLVDSAGSFDEKQERRQRGAER